MTLPRFTDLARNLHALAERDPEALESYLSNLTAPLDQEPEPFPEGYY